MFKSPGYILQYCPQYIARDDVFICLATQTSMYTISSKHYYHSRASDVKSQSSRAKSTRTWVELELQTILALFSKRFALHLYFVLLFSKYPIQTVFSVNQPCNKSNITLIMKNMPSVSNNIALASSSNIGADLGHILQY